MSTKEKERKRSSAFEKPSGEEAPKIERIAGHTAGLVEDLKAWFELKIEFVLLDFKEEMKATVLQYAYHAGFFVILLVAALFGLIALAFGAGAWLGHPGWGFLVVTGLLVIIAFVVKWISSYTKRKHGKVKSYSYRVKEAQSKLKEKGPLEPASRKLGARDMNQLRSPEPGENHHGKDQ